MRRLLPWSLAAISTTAVVYLCWRLPIQMTRIETMLGEHPEREATVTLRISTTIGGVFLESSTVQRPGETRESHAARAIADLSELVYAERERQRREGDR